MIYHVKRAFRGLFSLESLPCVAAVVLGAGAVVLSFLGNPRNAGLCIHSFLRDSMGALGAIRDSGTQFLRPELPGLVMGSFLSALVRREFKSRGGSSPLIRFVLGMLFMIGSAVFIGCSVRVMLRVGAGDGNGLVGLAGMFAGVWTGTGFIRKGFHLKRKKPAPVALAGGLVLGMLILIPLLLFWRHLLNRSVIGPGSRHAPVIVSLVAGIAIGWLAQASRFCVTSTVMYMIVTRSKVWTAGFILLLVSVMITSLLTGQFEAGVFLQPGSHSRHVWNFLAMFLLGMTASLLGGCPFRQFILLGEGDTDAGLTIAGMIAGMWIIKSFHLESDSLGPATGAEWLLISGLVLAAVIAAVTVFRNRSGVKEKSR